MQSQDAFLNSHKERRCESFGMILRWTHKCEFKVKVIYANQERGRLVQSGA